MKIEICVDSTAGVRAAAAAGADRVELCSALFEGGLTPSRGALRAARQVAGIGLHVMIRPRGGDFRPDADDLAAMACDVDTARQEGADGIVFGLLTPDGHIDAEPTRSLMERARPLAVTFHRAFDMTADALEALDTLIDLGVDRVLTSGQEATVLEGLPLIQRLIARAKDRIIVMPGGGITARNVARIVAAAHPPEIHFAALRPVASDMAMRRDHVFMGGELRAPEYGRLETDETGIRQVIARLPG